MGQISVKIPGQFSVTINKRGSQVLHGRPLTQQQRKAWSENMGHESEKITETHYEQLPEAGRFALFEEIANGKRDAVSSPRKMTNAQKIALLDELLAKVGWE